MREIWRITRAGRGGMAVVYLAERATSPAQLLGGPNAEERYESGSALAAVSP